MEVAVDSEENSSRDEFDDDDGLAKTKKNFCMIYLIIHPEKNSFKGLWDLFIYSGLAASYLLVPFTLAFDVVRTGDDRILARTIVWEGIFDSCFLIHIVLNFFTAYQHDLDWVMHPKKIAKNYL